MFDILTLEQTFENLTIMYFKHTGKYQMWSQRSEFVPRKDQNKLESIGKFHQFLKIELM